MLIYQTTENIKVTLKDDIPLGIGGEGSIYEIIKPSEYNIYVSKIYKKLKDVDQRERKIEYMIKNPPPEEAEGNIIWPVKSLHENKRFVGFIMNKVERSIKLNDLCLPCTYTDKGDWKKFCRDKNNAIELRLKLCANIARAVNNIHSTGKYVIVDLKPDNILVSSEGAVSIIDFDSIQISENNKVLFPALALTPDYIPREYYENNWSFSFNSFIRPSWDYFSMAVIFYQILFGIHPYIGTANGRYENCETPDQMIKEGLFPYGTKAKWLIKIPPPHRNFKNFPIEVVKELFKRSFDEKASNRPDANTWYNELKKEIEKFAGTKYLFKHKVHKAQSPHNIKQIKKSLKRAFLLLPIRFIPRPHLKTKITFITRVAKIITSAFPKTMILMTIFLLIFTSLPIMNKYYLPLQIMEPGHKWTFIEGLFHGFFAPSTAILSSLTSKVYFSIPQKNSPYISGFLIGIYFLPIVIHASNIVLSHKNLQFKHIDKIRARLIQLILSTIVFQIGIVIYSLSEGTTALDIISINQMLGNLFGGLWSEGVSFVIGLFSPLILIINFFDILFSGFAISSMVVSKNIQGFSSLTFLIGVWIYPIIQLQEDNFG